ncbi:MAG: hypothetical protein KDA79_16025, partial [Planctomycetaceae bacterium]|nr:hypothetical protein [Planctomycetaceae bacterium]
MAAAKPSEVAPKPGAAGGAGAPGAAADAAGPPAGQAAAPANTPAAAPGTAPEPPGEAAPGEASPADAEPGAAAAGEPESAADGDQSTTVTPAAPARSKSKRFLAGQTTAENFRPRLPGWFVVFLLALAIGLSTTAVVSLLSLPFAAEDQQPALHCLVVDSYTSPLLHSPPWSRQNAGRIIHSARTGMSVSSQQPASAFERSDFEAFFRHQLGSLKRDTAVVYLAARGASDRNAAALLPAEATVDSPAVGFPVTAMVQALLDAPARNILVVLEVDQSGDVLPNGLRRPYFVRHLRDAMREAEERSRTDRHLARKNLCILLPAEDGQHAAMSPSLSGTPFAIAAAYGLHGGLDADGLAPPVQTPDAAASRTPTADGIIRAKELSEYVRRSVANWSLEHRRNFQTPVILQLGDDFALVQVNSEITTAEVARLQAGAADAAAEEADSAAVAADGQPAVPGVAPGASPAAGNAAAAAPADAEPGSGAETPAAAATTSATGETAAAGAPAGTPVAAAPAQGPSAGQTTGNQATGSQATAAVAALPAADDPAVTAASGAPAASSDAASGANAETGSAAQSAGLNPSEWLPEHLLSLAGEIQQVWLRLEQLDASNVAFQRPRHWTVLQNTLMRAERELLRGGPDRCRVILDREVPPLLRVLEQTARNSAATETGLDRAAEITSAALRNPDAKSLEKLRTVDTLPARMLSALAPRLLDQGKWRHQASLRLAMETCQDISSLLSAQPELLPLLSDSLESADRLRAEALIMLVEGQAAAAGASLKQVQTLQLQADEQTDLAARQLAQVQRVVLALPGLVEWQAATPADPGDEHTRGELLRLLTDFIERTGQWAATPEPLPLRELEQLAVSLTRLTEREAIAALEPLDSERSRAMLHVPLLPARLRFRLLADLLQQNDPARFRLTAPQPGDSPSVLPVALALPGYCRLLSLLDTAQARQWSMLAASLTGPDGSDPQPESESAPVDFTNPTAAVDFVLLLKRAQAGAADSTDQHWWRQQLLCLATAWWNTGSGGTLQANDAVAQRLKNDARAGLLDWQIARLSRIDQSMPSKLASASIRKLEQQRALLKPQEMTPVVRAAFRLISQPKVSLQYPGTVTWPLALRVDRTLPPDADARLIIVW